MPFRARLRPAVSEAGESGRTSTSGGFQPIWNPNRDELFYLAPEEKLMAADVTARLDAIVRLDSGGRAIETPSIGLVSRSAQATAPRAPPKFSWPVALVAG